MFQFLQADGTPQPASRKQLFRDLFWWNLPASLGGLRRYAFGDREVPFGGATYSVGEARLRGFSRRPFKPLPADTEDWTLTLEDADNAWKDRLVDFHKGSEARLLRLREVDGTLSANAMYMEVGWLRAATPVDDERGRAIVLQFANEFWNREKNVAIQMTKAAEEAADPLANSIQPISKTIAWGAAQGTRRLYV